MRELAPADSGRQEARFTQLLAEKYALQSMSPEQEGVLSGHVVAVAVLIGHEVSLGHEAEFGHLPALEAPPQVVRHSERQCLQGGDDVYAVPMYIQR